MKKKRKMLIAAVMVATGVSMLNAQVGIGTTTPHSSSILHLNSPNKGLLLPNISLTSSTDNTTISSPATGLMIWNSGTGGLSPAGLYYWSGVEWAAVSATTSASSGSPGNNSPGNSSSASWKTDGNNNGSNAGQNTTMFIGTSTYDDLVFKVNSTFSGRLGSDRSVLLGTSTSGNQDAVAIGTNAKANSNQSTALGYGATAGGFQSMALGYGSKTTSNESTAVGYNAFAGGFESVALGYGAKTTSNGETAIGFNAQTNNQNSVALGTSSKSTGQNSAAIGYSSQTTAFNSLAVGVNAKATGQSSSAIGESSMTTALNAVALGVGAKATAQNSTAIGYNSTASQANAIVLGDSDANVGIGTSTPNTTVRLDVSGQYKLGSKGSPQKNQISFEVWPSVSINNLQSGRTAVLDIAIPATLQPSSTRATIVVSPAGDFDGNEKFGINNPRMTSTSNIRINLTNVSSGNESLNSAHFYVTINEF